MGEHGGHQEVVSPGTDIVIPVISSEAIKKRKKKHTEKEYQQTHHVLNGLTGWMHAGLQLLLGFGL